MATCNVCLMLADLDLDPSYLAHWVGYVLPRPAGDASLRTSQLG
jgi:hypothetical protein